MSWVMQHQLKFSTRDNRLSRVKKECIEIKSAHIFKQACIIHTYRQTYIQHKKCKQCDQGWGFLTMYPIGLKSRRMNSHNFNGWNGNERLRAWQRLVELIPFSHRSSSKPLPPGFLICGSSSDTSGTPQWHHRRNTWRRMVKTPNLQALEEYTHTLFF